MIDSTLNYPNEGKLLGKEFCALKALLLRLQAIHNEIIELNGGIAILHVEATVAALESRLRQQRIATD